MFSRGVGKETKFAPDDDHNVEPFFNKLFKDKLNSSGSLNQNWIRSFGVHFAGEDLAF